MNSMELEYRYMESGRWSEMNPSRCPCGGKGYVLSDLDTWHKCSVHGEGVLDMEAEEDLPDAEREAYVAGRRVAKRAMYADAFLHFSNAALAAGLSKDEVRAAVRREVGPGEHSQAAWVDAAERVAERVARDVAERAAQALGYSCALERQWDNDARAERAEHEAARH